MVLGVGAAIAHSPAARGCWGSAVNSPVGANATRSIACLRAINSEEARASVRHRLRRLWHYFLKGAVKVRKVSRIDTRVHIALLKVLIPASRPQDIIYR